MIKKRNLVLINARRAAGLTQGELAEKIGVANSSYSRYELLERLPSFEIQKKLCGLFRREYGLNVSIKDLFPLQIKRNYGLKQMQESAFENIIFLDDALSEIAIAQKMPLTENEYCNEENEDYVNAVVDRLLNAVYSRKTSASPRKVLTDLESGVLKNYFFEDKSVREIAEVYNVSEKRIYKNKGSALKKLKALVDGGFIDSI